MPDDQLFDITEAQNREVSGERGLHALLTHDTKADVGFLDHSNIIATITDACDNFTSALLDVNSNDSFLGRTTSADTNSLGLLRHIEEFLAQLLIRDDNTQRATINHQHMC